MKKIIFVRIFLSCMAILLVACGKRVEVTQAAEEEPIDTGAVAIAVMPTVDCMPLFVAKEHGFFENAGLKIALKMFTAQMDVDTAIVGQSVKGAVTDVFRAERIMANGTKLTYATQTESAWTLITNRLARLNKLEQFGDKMVAMTRFSATDYLTDAAFDGVKTTAPYFKVQINDVDIRQKMLINNELDAAWLPEPFATEAELYGHKRLKTKKQGKFGVLVFDKTYLDKRQAKDFLSRFQNVYSEACDSLNKYGLATYAQELKQYCHADTAVLNRMPKSLFAKSQQPQADILEIAKNANKQQ